MEADYLDILADSMDFLKDIPRAELRKFFKLKKTAYVKKNEYFQRAGEIPDRLGFSVSGLLRLFYVDESGREINKHFCTERTAVVAYWQFLRRERSEISIQALEDSKLYVIDHDAYDALLNGHPSWETVTRKLAEMILAILQKRESELLRNDAHGRYLNFLHDYPRLANRISQYHIASYIGVTPESLSRIRTNL